MMTETRSGARWFWLTASLFGLLTVAFLVWVIVFPNGAGWSNPVDDLGELLAALVAGAACSVAARRLECSRTACSSWPRPASPGQLAKPSGATTTCTGA